MNDNTSTTAVAADSYALARAVATVDSTSFFNEAPVNKLALAIILGACVTTAVSQADWINRAALPVTAVVAFASDASSRGTSIMNWPEVHQFRFTAPWADAQAMQAIHSLALAAFADRMTDVSYHAEVDHESMQPMLFLKIDTHGMDMGEIIARELQLFEKIVTDDALNTANRYHVISVV